MYLNCHSYFSFKYGTMSIDQLVQEGAAKNVNSMALTDINCTAGVFPFLKAAKDLPIHAVIGIDFRNGAQQQFIGLAKNHEGFLALNQYLSVHQRNKTPFPTHAPAWENVVVIYPFKTAHFPLRKNEYIGIHPDQIPTSFRSPWSSYQDKWVLLQPVTFRSQMDMNVHKLLRCIDLNILLSQLPSDQKGKITDCFYFPEDLKKRCAPLGWLLHQTQALLHRCHFNDGFKPVENKKWIFGNDQKDFNFLKKATYAGAHKRYKNITSEIESRILKELDIIQQKKFISYFLINLDIVNFAREHGYYYIGRGSGANSIVAYCLFITDVDPIELDLYFERFINLYRKNPPDFDIDFSWKDRDEIINYIFRTYNSSSYEHVCLLATHTTFKTKSAIRELGKVFGLPKTDIEALIDHAARPGQSGLDKIGKLVIKYSGLIQDMPSHLSIHAGGIIISQNPIHYYTATDLPPKGFPISHFDMTVSEEIGFSKFDILSQRGLGHIRDSLEIIKVNQGKDIDIHRITDFKKDIIIKEHLRTGRTMGAFYVESPAMRMLLAKLKADEYLGLVAASSIIRPGVARSGMMREYILRHRQPEERRNRAHPILYDLMPETYGIMVYQEDVIKVAHYFAGLSFDEADVLRRGMSGKFRSKSEFQLVKESFFKKSKEKGRDAKTVQEVWFQIESFAGYSFAKGHSASFAVESYQSLYLKAHFPLEFMVGVINNFGGFYRTEFYIHELKMNGADVQAPHINESENLTSIKGKTVYLGFIHLKFLKKEISTVILQERSINGAFTSLRDFIRRILIPLEQLLILIRIDAFRFLPKNKQELMWEAHFLLHKQSIKPSVTLSLFHQPSFRELQIPTLEKNDTRQNILDQLDILEFPLENPFSLIKNSHKENILAKDFKKRLHQNVQIIGYLVTIKYTRTTKGEVMLFGTFLDQEGNWIDTVHFPQTAKKHPISGKGLYLLRGKITEEFDFFTLEINQCERIPYWKEEDG